MDIRVSYAMIARRKCFVPVLPSATGIIQSVSHSVTSEPASNMVKPSNPDL